MITAKMWQIFTCFKTKHTNQNCVCERLKTAQQPGDRCRPSVQDLAYLCLLYEYLNNETKRTKSLPLDI